MCRAGALRGCVETPTARPVGCKEHLRDVVMRIVVVLVVLIGLTACRGPACDAQRGAPEAAAARGLRRGAETRNAMAVLGLGTDADPRASTVFLLGYPNLGLTAIAGAVEPFTGDPTGLHHT